MADKHKRTNEFSWEHSPRSPVNEKCHLHKLLCSPLMGWCGLHFRLNKGEGHRQEEQWGKRWRDVVWSSAPLRILGPCWESRPVLFSWPLSEAACLQGPCVEMRGHRTARSWQHPASLHDTSDIRSVCAHLHTPCTHRARRTRRALLLSVMTVQTNSSFQMSTTDLHVSKQHVTRQTELSHSSSHFETKNMNVCENLKIGASHWMWGN